MMLMMMMMMMMMMMLMMMMMMMMMMLMMLMKMLKNKFEKKPINCNKPSRVRYRPGRQPLAYLLVIQLIGIQYFVSFLPTASPDKVFPFPVVFCVFVFLIPNPTNFNQAYYNIHITYTCMYVCVYVYMCMQTC